MGISVRVSPSSANKKFGDTVSNFPPPTIARAAARAQINQAADDITSHIDYAFRRAADALCGAGEIPPLPVNQRLQAFGAEEDGREVLAGVVMTPGRTGVVPPAPARSRATTSRSTSASVTADSPCGEKASVRRAGTASVERIPARARRRVALAERDDARLSSSRGAGQRVSARRSPT